MKLYASTIYSMYVTFMIDVVTNTRFGCQTCIFGAINSDDPVQAYWLVYVLSICVMPTCNIPAKYYYVLEIMH